MTSSGVKFFTKTPKEICSKISELIEGERLRVGGSADGRMSGWKRGRVEGWKGGSAGVW